MEFLSEKQWRKIRVKYLKHNEVLRNHTWQELTLENFRNNEQQ